MDSNLGCRKGKNVPKIPCLKKLMVSSAPTIPRPQVLIPSTPSMLFSICTNEIVMRKGRK